MHDHTGQLLNVQPLPQKLFGSNSYNGRRGEIHNILLNYARKIGVDVRFGQDVEEYYEDSDRERAGVIVDGRQIEGDVVVGADGVRSRARELVLVRMSLQAKNGPLAKILAQGYEDKPQPSDYAVYRSWFNARDHGLDEDPLTKVFCQRGGAFHGWVGQSDSNSLIGK